MSTSKKITSKKPKTDTNGVTVASPSTIAAPAAAPTLDSTATAKVPNVVLVQLPPSGATIPSPPTGFVATSGTDYRGLTPKRAELAVLPKALEELGRFTDYAAVFGKTAPPLAALQQTLNAALEWSQMRNATDAWDLFSRTMEGIAWTQARTLMDKLHPTFTAAVATDATIETQNPSLASLLNAAKVIAQKGAATRKANDLSKAKGEAPVHGKAAAKVRRAAKLVAQTETQPTVGTTAAATTPTTATPATTAQPTVATAAAPAAPGGTVTPGTNGAAH